VDVGVDVGLLVRPLAAVALGVGHRDADREVAVLGVVEPRREALGIARAVVGVDARGRLHDRTERVVREVALAATGLLAEHADRLELVEQVAARAVDVDHAVHGLAARRLLGEHDRRKLFAQREVVADADGVDAGRELRRVGNALDALAVDEHARREAAQRLAILAGAHQHRSLPKVRRSIVPTSIALTHNGRSERGGR